MNIEDDVIYRGYQVSLAVKQPQIARTKYLKGTYEKRGAEGKF